MRAGRRSTLVLVYLVKEAITMYYSTRLLVKVVYLHECGGVKGQCFPLNCGGGLEVTKTATNDYFHYRFICRLFLR